jgi:hypothetical protein
MEIAMNFFIKIMFENTKNNTNIYICSYLNKPLRKNMRRNIPTTLGITILFALILISACIAQPPAQSSSQQDQGLARITSDGESSRLSFTEAKMNLLDSLPDSMNETGSGTNIYYIFSRDLDESGNSTSWIFGVSGNNGPEFLVVDKEGWTTIENVVLPPEPIVFENIVTPGELFKQNRAVIFTNLSPGVPERRDLELQRGVYTLTITSGNSSRSLIFNATTGVLIT